MLGIYVETKAGSTKSFFVEGCTESQGRLKRRRCTTSAIVVAASLAVRRHGDDACTCATYASGMASPSNAPTTLTFAPFASSLTPEFWSAFAKLKVDVLKLSDEAVPLSATYSAGKTVRDRETGVDIALQPYLHFDASSFDKQVQPEVYGK